MGVVTIRVNGKPIPQGSMTALISHTTSRPILKPSNEKDLHAWRELVSWSAAAAWSGKPLSGPCRVALSFFLPRPRYHFDKGRIKDDHLQVRPASKPDIDKLVRAVLDGLTGIVFHDDSQAVDLIASKSYAKPAPEGCAIEIAWEEK